jgi:hypothetical protein
VLKNFRPDMEDSVSPDLIDKVQTALADRLLLDVGVTK